MQFKIASSDTFSWPVTIKIPVDHGKVESFRQTVLFKRLPMSVIDEIRSRPGILDWQMAKEFVVGFGDDIVDPDDNPVPFNDANLEAFLNIPTVGSAVAGEYIRAVMLGEAKRKN